MLQFAYKAEHKKKRTAKREIYQAELEKKEAATCWGGGGGGGGGGSDTYEYSQ